MNIHANHNETLHHLMYSYAIRHFTSDWKEILYSIRQMLQFRFNKLNAVSFVRYLQVRVANTKERKYTTLRIENIIFGFYLQMFNRMRYLQLGVRQHEK